jgi:peptidoglycan/LPS O-acetylase OafA/YrhL
VTLALLIRAFGQFTGINMEVKFRAGSDASIEGTQSAVISFLRGIAALEVAASHLRLQFFPDYSSVVGPSILFKFIVFITGFAHLAVVLFFVLSGWLVGGALLRNMGSRTAFVDYLIDRITRLWIVLIPCFLLMIVLAWLQEAAFGLPSVSDKTYAMTSFLGNLVGLQTLLVPIYANNFPLWSLSNETWYYLAFPVAVQVYCARKLVGALFFLSILISIGIVVSSEILWYFPIWCLGVLGSRIAIWISGKSQCILLIVLLGLASYFRVAGQVNDLNSDSFAQDFIFAFMIVLFLCAVRGPEVDRKLQRFNIRKYSEVFASFSFTLYVLHLPLQRFLGNVPAVKLALPLDPHGLQGIVTYFVFLFFIVIFAFIFHLPFEAQTGRLRKFFKRILLRNQSRSVVM